MLKLKPTLYLLLSMYVAGVIGLNLDSTAGLFKILTPFNLLFSTFILLYFHLDKSKFFIFFVVVTFMIGYWIEVVGVNTGLIFGKYEYDTTLGFEVFNVPLIIGFNWLIVAYCSGHLVHKLAVPKIVQIILAALLMTTFDYVVEPVAIRLDMWSWFGKEPPLSNYVGWFITSFVIQIIYFYAPFKKENPVAVWLFALQTLFFGIQRLL
ncbi:MAG: carotenoid biosynthesis protein [Spirosomataceae bacterium]|jgi:uncharacterized membrane protein